MSISARAKSLCHVIGVTIVLSVFLISGPRLSTVDAQTANQSYTCGTYGAGEFGTNDCVVTQQESPKSSGSMPLTGAQLSMMAAIGMILTAVGLALYGKSRRSSSATPIGDHS